MSNSYLAIDGISIDEQFKRNLNESSVFTDQNFAGSNLSIINKQFSYVFSLLLYNLNQNIHGGLYSETEIYENMNRILKFMSYKPIGYQTAFTPVDVIAGTTLAEGTYFIPRFSYVQKGGIRYSLMEDISFSKTSSAESVVSTDVVFYQGEVREFYISSTQGVASEKYIVTADASTYIDHNTIQVYVKRAGLWEKWESTTSLFLNKGTEKVYDIRLNENKKYEITFGNNINGSQLNVGESIAVYYLKSSAKTGEIAANTFNRRVLTVYKSSQFSNILQDTATVSNITSDGILITNTCPSSNFQEMETVAEMRTNAPNLFNSQFRLITENDYDVFIRSNFGNLIHDVKVLNNNDYLDTYIKYFHAMGLNDAELDSRALYNQLNFADSCNFNNIYGFVVPKYNIGVNYVSPSQKTLMINTIKREKTLTSDFIVADPVYIYFDLAVNNTVAEKPEDAISTVLTIKKNRNSKRNSEELRIEIANIIKSYFSPQSLKLGQTIDMLSITNSILGISDVDSITTNNILTGSSKQGIQFISWNPAFSTVSTTPVSTNIMLEVFQFPYFRNLSTIESRIVII